MYRELFIKWCIGPAYLVADVFAGHGKEQEEKVHPIRYQFRQFRGSTRFAPLMIFEQSTSVPKSHG